jgi:hypothetical protein
LHDARRAARGIPSELNTTSSAVPPGAGDDSPTLSEWSMIILVLWISMGGAGFLPSRRLAS